MDRKIIYEDLELLFEQDGPSYQARVIRSPTGETPEQPFEAPFEDLELENLVLSLQRTRGRARRIDAPDTERIKKFGGDLYEALFQGELKVCLRRSMDAAESRDHGLRLRLRLGDCPALLDVPWELLYDRSRNLFVCLSPLTPVVRYLPLDQQYKPLRIALPLRILVMISDPVDYERLDVAKERSNLLAAVQPLQQAGRVEVDVLPAATLPALQQALRANDYHIFHFIGHGGFDEARRDGVLLLESDDRGLPVSGEVIGTYLCDHRSLRLAVLNACEGGRSDRQDPFAGVAQTLMQQGIPAVIAMQFEITDTAAIMFAGGFYAAVAAGLPVDAALADARRAIFGQPNPTEWATPVLYMRSADGTLFHLRPGKPATLPVQAPADPHLPVPGQKDEPPPDASSSTGSGSQRHGQTGSLAPIETDARHDGSRAPADSADRTWLRRAWRWLAAAAAVILLAGAGIVITLRVLSGGHQGWPFSTDGSVFTRPFVNGSIVYVGSLDHHVYALNASGTLRWSYRTQGQVYSPPSVAGTVVYVGSNDGHIYALRAAARASPRLLWRYPGHGAARIGAVQSGAILVRRKMVVFGSNDGHVYALRAAAQASPRLIWQYPRPSVQSIGSVRSTPYVYPGGPTGDIYVGSDDGHLYALTEAGRLRWSYPPRGSVGNYAFAMPSGFPTSGIPGGQSIYVGSENHYLYALHARTGEPAWKYRTGGPITSQPAVSRDDVIYVGSGDSVYALEDRVTHPKVAWVRTFPGHVSGPEVTENGYVYVCSGNLVYALDVSSGRTVWSRRAGFGTLTTPAISGNIYVGSNDRNVYALRFDGQPVR